LPRSKHDSPPAPRAAKKGARPRKGAAAARSDSDGAPAEAAAEEEGAEGAEAETVDDEEGGADGDREGDLGDDIDAAAVEGSEEEGDVPVPSSRTLNESSSIERFDALQMYLREVQRHPLLTPEETHAAAVKFLETQDSATAARLVTANLRLVVKIAYEYRRAYKNIMDLIQEGNIGLMQAVKRYDPYRGVKLSSYAAWWIRAYILRFILNNWRLVKLGTTQAQRKLFFNLRK